VSNSEATTYKPMVNLGGWQRGNNSMSAQRNNSTYWSIKPRKTSAA
jgi:hypothetical protein